ncbi:MAG: serine hydrolase, partial [Bdellovibrionales bacterium]
MNAFEKALKKKITSEVADLSAVTPGVVIEVHQRGRKKGTLRLGETYRYYDLASLTKIIFTASYSMGYFSDHPGELKLPVNRVLPWWKAKTTPFELLSHTGGLDWWKPYYKSLKGPMEPQARWDQLKKLLARGKPGRKGKALYSDLDLWMMGSFLEVSTQQSLLEMYESLSERLDLKNIFFHPRNKPRYARKLYAPTEACPW